METFSKSEQESRKDFIDKHTPYIFCEQMPIFGSLFNVRIRVGKEHAHIDDYDHHIAYITLFNGDKMLAKANFSPCVVSTDERRGHAEVSFVLMANQISYTFNAQCYCTKHGLWESEKISLTVQR